MKNKSYLPSNLFVFCTIMAYLFAFIFVIHLQEEYTFRMNIKEIKQLDELKYNNCIEYDIHSFIFCTSKEDEYNNFINHFDNNHYVINNKNIKIENDNVTYYYVVFEKIK